MTDICHLKSCRTINAIKQVSGGNPDKGTQSVCLFARASGKAREPVLLLHAWNGRQLTDLTSATLP